MFYLCDHAIVTLDVFLVIQLQRALGSAFLTIGGLGEYFHVQSPLKSVLYDLLPWRDTIEILSNMIKRRAVRWFPALSYAVIVTAYGPGLGSVAFT